MAAGKREFLERVVEDLSLDIRDPFTLLLANAMALADQRDALKAELSTHQSSIEEAEGRCCPEDVGFEEWIGVLKKRDNVVAHTHLQELVSLLLQTMVPIGPMRDRTDYPVELQRAIDFLHGRAAPSAVEALRHGQALAVVPLVGNVLDHWDRLPNDLKDQIRETSEGLVQAIDAVNHAMEHHEPVVPSATLRITDEVVERALAAANGAMVDTRRHWTDGDRAAVRAMLEAAQPPDRLARAERLLREFITTCEVHNVRADKFFDLATDVAAARAYFKDASTDRSADAAA